jgi:hypothetical protein
VTYKLQRRGVRAIVSRGIPVDGKVTLTLSCGHTATINYRPDAEFKNANCRACKHADAMDREAKRARGDGAT